MGDTVVVRVGPRGRVVIPAAMRRALGIGEGTALVARIEHGGVLLVPRDAVRDRLRELFAEVPVSLADELIAERRAEADQQR